MLPNLVFDSWTDDPTSVALALQTIEACPNTELK